MSRKKKTEEEKEEDKRIAQIKKEVEDSHDPIAFLVLLGTLAIREGNKKIMREEEKKKNKPSV